MPFYSLFNPISSIQKKRTANIRARSPIKLLELLMNAETYTFKHELENGPQIKQGLVMELFNHACDTSNVNAIFALAQCYPKIIDAASVSKQLNRPRSNIDALTNGLILEKDNAPDSLKALYTGEPQPGVTKLFTQYQQQEFTNLAAGLKNPTNMIIGNGEPDDCVTAIFEVTPIVDSSPNPDTHEAPQILAKNEIARAMLPNFERWFKTRRELNFNLPNYVPMSDSAGSNKI